MRGLLVDTTGFLPAMIEARALRLSLPAHREGLLSFSPCEYLSLSLSLSLSLAGSLSLSLSLSRWLSLSLSLSLSPSPSSALLSLSLPLLSASHYSAYLLPLLSLFSLFTLFSLNLFSLSLSICLPSVLSLFSFLSLLSLLSLLCLLFPLSSFKADKLHRCLVRTERSARRFRGSSSKPNRRKWGFASFQERIPEVRECSKKGFANQVLDSLQRDKTITPKAFQLWKIKRLKRPKRGWVHGKLLERAFQVFAGDLVTQHCCTFPEKLRTPLPLIWTPLSSVWQKYTTETLFPNCSDDNT